jgi:hypothetical protein
VPHHVLDGDHIELLNREAAEGMSQIVEASSSNVCGLLSPDDALANSRSVEWAAVRPAEDEVLPRSESRSLLELA